MVLGRDSMLLDVGRQQRLASVALRDALAQRDKGCSFPGCGRPPRYCHAHHIVSWLDWGPTVLHNMCLLCERHHVIVYRQGWHIRLGARGHPEFTPTCNHRPRASATPQSAATIGTGAVTSSLCIVHPIGQRDELVLRVLQQAVDRRHHRAGPRRRADPAVAAGLHLVFEQQPTDERR